MTTTPAAPPKTPASVLDQIAAQVRASLEAFDERLQYIEDNLPTNQPGPVIANDDELHPPLDAEGLEQWLEWLWGTYHLKEAQLVELSRNTALQQEFNALYVAFVSVASETKPSFGWVHWHDALARVMGRLNQHTTARTNIQEAPSN